MIIAAIPGFELGALKWHRLTNYEIAHVEPQYSRTFDWELTADRNALIAGRAALALAGDAAESFDLYPVSPITESIDGIYDRVGKIAFELAHEWLTLQRHDPDQHTIELEIQRLFQQVQQFLYDHAPLGAIATLRKRIIENLQNADTKEIDSVVIFAEQLWRHLERPSNLDVSFKETLYQ